VPRAKPRWSVYIVRCANKSLYTGITTDLTARLKAHNGGRGGARYTRAFGPVELVWNEVHRNRSSASRREAQIKRFPRAQKLRLFAAL